MKPHAIFIAVLAALASLTLGGCSTVRSPATLTSAGGDGAPYKFPNPSHLFLAPQARTSLEGGFARLA